MQALPKARDRIRIFAKWLSLPPQEAPSKVPCSGFEAASQRLGPNEKALEVVRGMLPPVRISDEDVEHSASDKSTGLLDRCGRRLAGYRQQPIQPLSRHNEKHALSLWLIKSAGDVIRGPMTNLF
jgi:hypothetical protein